MFSRFLCEQGRNQRWLERMQGLELSPSSGSGRSELTLVINCLVVNVPLTGSVCCHLPSERAPGKLQLPKAKSYFEFSF